jgi:uncharacterized protein (DUF1800 family)
MEPRVGLSARSASRRAALMGTMAVGAVALLPAGAASAATRTKMLSARDKARQLNQGTKGSFVVPQVHQADIPDAWTRHMLSRFSGGVSQKRLDEVTAAGGIDAWFQAQLSPDTVDDPDGDALWSWYPSLSMTPAQRFEASRTGTPGWLQMQDLANYVTMRRLVSTRQVEEMMVDFWSNLVHVASPASDCWTWRIEYEETIRQYALGKYNDLLQATITHPAMSLYLGNYMSTAQAINENLGRELMECHTVGVNAGYTQKDVVASSRILTGFSVDWRHTMQQTYIPANHWVGRVKVMGFSSPNAKPDGRAVLTSYLSYLAHHPATASRVCQRLAVRFVSDTPSDDLVSMLAQTYLDNDTDIKPVLTALVASDEFQNSAMGKVRTPVEDAVATWAALGVQVAQPAGPKDAANQVINVSKGIGQIVYDWPTPDAFPDVAPAWTDSGRMLGSMHEHYLAANGNAPSTGITYKQPMDWMPQLPTTFDNVVDYIARSLLFLESTSTMLQACCVATDCNPTDVITPTHPLIRYKFPRLLVSLLDTPEHMSR